MAHTVGAEQLPIPVAAASGASPGAPFIGTLLDGFKQAIELYCEDAWSVLAPAEPIVRTAYCRQPEQGDFLQNDLPTLYLYADSIGAHQQVADSINLRPVQLTLLWVPPPAPDAVAQERSQFWVGIDNALFAVTKPEAASADTTSTAWGRSLKNKAALWSLELGSANDLAIQVPTGDGQTITYQGYAWQLTAMQRYQHDKTTGPLVPAKMQATFKGGPDADLDQLVAQQPQNLWE